MLGRTYSEEVLSHIFYAAHFTRRLDKYGSIKFRNWRFFGEDGLSGEDVSVWVYEGSLKIEYQATALSLYSLTFQPDHKHILDVKNPRRIETHFRSFTCGSFQTQNGCFLCVDQNRSGASGVSQPLLYDNSRFLSLTRPDSCSSFASAAEKGAASHRQSQSGHQEAPDRRALGRSARGRDRGRERPRLHTASGGSATPTRQWSDFLSSGRWRPCALRRGVPRQPE